MKVLYFRESHLLRLYPKNNFLLHFSAHLHFHLKSILQFAQNLSRARFCHVTFDVKQENEANAVRNKLFV